MKTFILFLFMITLTCCAFTSDDIRLRDFEGGSYAKWTVRGEAFGSGPTKGSHPRQ